MTVTPPQGAHPVPPPGWYPDPQDAQAQRYWDGSRWTNRTRRVRSGGLSSRAIITIVVVICVTLITLAALFTFLFLSFFRSFDPLFETLFEEVADDLRAHRTAQVFLPAVADGDTDAFRTLWCSSPGPDGTAADAAQALKDEVVDHGTVTDAEIQRSRPGADRLEVEFVVTHDGVRRDWVATLVEEGDRGWRVCGAEPER